MKPKESKPANIKKSFTYDQCQTPHYAIEPLIKFMPKIWLAWECAAGEGYLVDALFKAKRMCIGTDILTGENFFDYEPADYDCIITNPPYSIKYEWLERCYELGKPFALLMPLETLGAWKAQKLFRKHGMQLIILNKRVDFKMPNVGWSGSGAQFPVAWFTYGFGLEKDIVYADIVKRPNEQMALPLNGR